MQETTALNWKSAGFREVSDKILSVINSPDSIQQISRLLSNYVSNFPLDNVSSSFINIISYFINKDIVALFGEYEQLQKMINADDVGLIPGLYNLIWLDVQMSLPRAQNPVSRKCYKNYRANISALKKSNPELAEKVRQSTLSDNYIVVDFWGGLHIFDKESSKVLDVPSNMNNAFDGMANDIRPVALTSIFSGQEIIKCLENRFNGLHGMARAHYLIEEDLSKVRTLLDIYDFSRYIETEELLLFVGEDCKEQFEDTLETCLYPFPVLTMGDDELVAELCGKVKAKVDPSGLKEQVFDYYKSDEFDVRLRKIAKGEILPRILISTCRWTTFLKYCAADFDRSFASFGCETRYIIEGSDTQRLSSNYHYKEVLDFKPDMIFMISHARPSLSYIPSELPVVCYLQDRCGPLEQEQKLDECTESHDLFICMLSGFRDYLIRKGAEKDQVFVFPIPADEKMFYPMDVENAAPYADIAYVKHGSADGAQLHKNFLAHLTKDDLSNNVISIITSFYNLLYDKVTSDLSVCWSEKDIQELSESHIKGMSEEFRNWFYANIYNYYVNVYSAIWRYQFLEELANRGFDLALYGNNWKENSRLSIYSQGPVQRGIQLNKVYNFSKINLSIVHTVSMHQRLAECALAGGFIMVADPGGQDWEPAKKYYHENTELVLFKDKKELIDKVCYYLNNDNERAEIAGRMRERALKERTCAYAVEVILEEFRANLRRVKYGNH